MESRGPARDRSSCADRRTRESRREISQSDGGRSGRQTDPGGRSGRESDRALRTGSIGDLRVLRNARCRLYSRCCPSSRPSRGRRPREKRDRSEAVGCGKPPGISRNSQLSTSSSSAISAPDVTSTSPLGNRTDVPAIFRRWAIEGPRSKVPCDRRRPRSSRNERCRCGPAPPIASTRPSASSTASCLCAVSPACPRARTDGSPASRSPRSRTPPYSRAVRCGRQ